MYKVLIVDDNLNDRNGLAELIEWHEMGIDEIFLAKNGKEGLEKALEFKPTLIISDVVMPIMDGLEMAEHIIEQMPNMKFIFMSCYDEADYIRKTLDYDSYGYLLKPINIEKLKETISRILNTKRSEAETNEALADLRLKVEKNKEHVREIVVQDIVYGNMNEENLLQLEDLQLNVRCKYTIIVINLDSDLNNDAGISCMVLYALKTYIDSVVPDYMRAHSFLQSKTSMVLIVYFDKELGDNEITEQFLGLMTQIKDYANDKLKSNAIICLGELGSSLMDASNIYNNIEYAVRKNIYEMNNAIILAEDENNKKEIIDYDIFTLKNEIIGLFENEDIGKLEEFICGYYEDRIYNKSYLRQTTFILVSVLQIVLFDRNESFVNVFGSDCMVWDKMASFDTILDIKQWVLNVFVGAYQYLNERKTGIDKKVQIVNEIKHIIDTEYGKLDNVGQITDRLYLSSGYANRIFKKHEGLTIFEYLVNVRMEKAKDMLKNTDKKVQDIANEIGYSSRAYFTSLFYEYTGKTPSNYRNQE